MWPGKLALMIGIFNGSVSILGWPVKQSDFK